MVADYNVYIDMLFTRIIALIIVRIYDHSWIKIIIGTIEATNCNLIELNKTSLNPQSKMIFGR